MVNWTLEDLENHIKEYDENYNKIHNYVISFMKRYGVEHDKDDRGKVARALSAKDTPTWHKLMVVELRLRKKGKKIRKYLIEIGEL